MPPTSSEKYLQCIAIDSVTDSFACQCEYPIGCAAISLRKAGLLRYTRNDISRPYTSTIIPSRAHGQKHGGYACLAADRNHVALTMKAQQRGASKVLRGSGDFAVENLQVFSFGCSK